jgi:Ca2+/Na+ antiporter
VFDFTFALGISALTSYFYHKQEISLKIEGIIWLILLYISSVIYVTYISSLADLKLYHLVFLLCCIPFTYEVFKLSSSYSSSDGKDF